EIECRSPIRSRFCPNPSAVAMNNPLHNCQTYAGAFKFVRAMQSLEHTEKLVRVLHVEPGAVVGNKINVLSVLTLGANFDDGIAPIAGILDRVGKKVRPNLFQ